LLILLLNPISKIAEDIARSAPAGRSILVDAFAGAGGNTIAFARTGKWKRVYAIEKNPAVLQCAKHNAQVYGVADKITWFEGDCFSILKNQLKELAPYSIIFASPPWGGMSFPFSFAGLAMQLSNPSCRPWVSFG
jgi:trimethylguanosine synthase